MKLFCIKHLTFCLLGNEGTLSCPCPNDNEKWHKSGSAVSCNKTNNSVGCSCCIVKIGLNHRFVATRHYSGMLQPICLYVCMHMYLFVSLLVFEVTENFFQILYSKFLKRISMQVRQKKCFISKRPKA